MWDFIDWLRYEEDKIAGNTCDGGEKLWRRPGEGLALLHNECLNVRMLECSNV